MSLSEETRSRTAIRKGTPARQATGGVVAGQSLLDTRRLSCPSEPHNGHWAGRGNTWSYYVFRQGVRLLQGKGAGQRISINGVPGMVVLEP